MKELYANSYKTLMKGIKEDKHKWKNNSMFMEHRNSYYQNIHTTQSRLQFQCNTYQEFNGIFYRTQKKFRKPNEQDKYLGCVLRYNKETKLFLTLMVLFFSSIWNFSVC